MLLVVLYEPSAVAMAAAVAAFLAVGTHQSVTKDEGVLGKMLTVANAVK